MKSKRLLTMLLVLCMLVSTLSPAVSAVAYSDDSVLNSSKTDTVVTNNTTSAQSGLLVSGSQTKGQQTLRDEALVKSEIETPETDTTGNWIATDSKVKPSVSLTLKEMPECLQELEKAAEVFEKNEAVTAFVVMKDAPLAERYSSIAQVAASEEKAMLDLQDSVIRQIERTVLKGSDLDVRYQFTYLTNSFTIQTEFENLAKIAKLDNVKSVFVMPVYDAIPTGETADPNTASAGAMTGVANVWADLGYTGTGMKIAVIDTGLDLDHPSFAAEPETTETSLSVADIDAVLKDLNAYDKRSTITAKTLYRSAKVPYAFNYVDNSLTADHSADSMGDHGTHVAGIAAANATEGTTVVGMAPDAQIIVMKVFGAAGGAYTDDIVAALEDAMTLGCDVVNLSLGSSGGFSSDDSEIDLIYERLNSQDIIATISAGNEDVMSDGNMWGTELNRTQNPDNATIGSPGTYINATTIASADNAKVPGNYFTLADGTQVFYVNPYECICYMTDMAGQEVEYVRINGLGEESDFYDEEGNSLVEGKVAIVMRGELSFSTKIFNAQYAGAIACLVQNNNTTDDIFSFGMQIYNDDGEFPSIPSALIGMEDGFMMAEAETQTLVVSEEEAVRENASAGQMSYFSSWGCSPNLSLEPDLTGIGGSVYSCYDGGQYGLMSGTSMSAPQVAGVSALVMQYLHELYPDAIEGSIRDMAEALLMSTADPIISADSGVEASPRQQGAGLVDALEATTTKAYLTVGGNSPKAELGDSSTGKYTFSFEIHNFGEEDKTYTFDSSLLTEIAAGGYGEYFMYGMDMELSGSVTFDKDSVTVPAGGKKNVKVTIKLSDEDKAYFDECWENGGYVEGYIYLNAETEDGALVNELNLPFLGFYGDWTEAPVFDTAYWYDNSFWSMPPAGGLPEGDEFWHILWTDLVGTDWILGFNPYSGALADNEGNIFYDPSHNVISPNGDGALDGLKEIYLSLLRNAKTLTFTYTVDGEVVSRETILNNTKTMFLSSYGQIVPWIYSWYGNGMYDFTDANGNALPTGTEVMMTVDAKVDYGTGGEHTLQIPLYIDVTGPELVNVYEVAQDDHYYMVVEAADETALASVVLMNPAGTQIYAQHYDVTMDPTEDGTYLAYFDITDMGTEFMVAVCDYACNESYFQITYQASDDNLPEMPTDQLYAYRLFDDAIYSDHMYGWVSMALNESEEDGNTADISVWTDDYMEYAAISAAEYAGGKIFGVEAVTNKLVVMDPGLFNRSTICDLGVYVLDMTFDDSTDTMYVLAKEDSYYIRLYTLDIMTGELTLVKDYDYYYYAPYAITDDDNGTLFAIKYAGSNLYTLDADNDYEMTTINDPDGNAFVITDSTGAKTNPTYAQSIAYVDGSIFWAYYKYSWYGGSSELIEIDMDDLSTDHYTFVAQAYDAEDNLVSYNPITEMVGLLTLDETEWQIPEATELKNVNLDNEKLVMTVGQSATLTASPVPWNYELGELTWTTSDESVATVSDGRVTGVGEGTATITVTTENASASCEVTVAKVTGNFNAYNYFSGDGYYGYMIDVDLDTMNYNLVTKSPVDFLAADYNGHDGYYYGYADGGQFYRMDLETGKATKLGDPIGTAPSDMAYDYSTGLMYAITMDYNSGSSSLCTVNLNNGQLETVYMLQGIYMMTLACDLEGTIYTITADGMLVQLGLVYDDRFEEYTWAATPIMMDLGYLQYMQSMCYDYANDVLLWGYCENASVYWVDIKAAEPYAISLGDPTESGMFEFVGMYTVPAEIPELDYVAVESVTASDMTMLVGTTKFPNATVKPFNATEQTLKLTSDNASVVTVNADGTLTAVAEGTANITGTLTDGSNTFDVAFSVTVLQGADNVYGMVMTELSSMGGQYWIRIYPQDTTDPDLMTFTDYVIYAEEYYNGKLYALGYDPNDWSGNWQYFVMDPTTYAVESQTAMGDAYPFVYDMTYDYATSTMYAVAGPSDNASDLYVFDMATGELIPLLQTEQFFMSLAAGPNGKLYAMENSKQIISDDEYWDPWAPAEYGNAMLYEVDPIAGTVKLVGDTGVKCNMLASMSYDYDTQRLYWTPLYQGSSYTGGLHLVDPETGAATNLGPIHAVGAQVSGLYIISDNFPAEPDPVLSKLLITPDKATITAGNTTDVNVYTLPMGLDADVVWTSSNKSVATVDENGVVTGVAQGKANITATVTFDGVTKSISCPIGVLDADAAFLTYNTTDGGWANISRADGSVTNLTEASDETAVNAITAVDGTVYGYDAELNFFSMDPDTLERTAIGTADAAAAVEEYLSFMGYDATQIESYASEYTMEIRDLAYDAANDRVLALGAVVGALYGDEMNAGDALYEVDLTNGSLTEVYRFQEHYNIMAMTVGTDGTVYYYTAYNDYYYALDLNTGIYTGIISGQTQSLYGSTESIHALHYDELTGLMYHLFTSNGSFYRLLTVDPASGVLDVTYEFVGDVEYNYDTWSYEGDSFAGLTFIGEIVEAPTLDAPEVTVSNVASSGKIKLTWNAVDGAEKYIVYRAGADGAYKKMFTTANTSYTNTGAVAGETYSYYVVAVAGDITSDSSNVVSATCDLARPVVTASNVASTGKVKLTWNAVDGAVKYKVYRATDKDGAYSLMKTTTSTSYINTNSQAGEAYYYYVVAIAENTAANSAASSVKMRTCDLAQPKVTASVTSAGNPKLTWKAVDGAVSYKVYRAESADGQYKLMKTATGTSYTNTNNVAGTTYYYKVMAVAEVSAANSAYSAIVSATAK